MRKAPEDLYRENVVPPTYWDDPERAYEMRRADRDQKQRQLNAKLDRKRRPSVADLTAKKMECKSIYN